MSNKFFESIGGAPAYSMVAVAVKGSVGDAVGGAASRRALRWTVENLLPNVDRLVLVHVMPTVTTIPSPCKFDLATQSLSSISWSLSVDFVCFEAGSKIPVEELEESVVSMYKRDLRKEYEQVFVPFKKLCGSSKVSFSLYWLFEFLWNCWVSLMEVFTGSGWDVVAGAWWSREGAFEVRIR